MLNPALFSSVKDDWPTPWEFFHNLDLEFNFTLDVCAVPWSAKVWRYCVPPYALRVWGETMFRRLDVYKRQALSGSTVVFVRRYNSGSSSVCAVTATPSDSRTLIV